MPNVYGEKSNTRVQWEKVKQGSFQERFDWLVHYYGVYALIVLFVVGIIVAWVIVANRPKKPELLTGTLFDANLEDEEENAIKTRIAEMLGVNADDYQSGIHSSIFWEANTEEQLNQQEVIITRVSARELDFLGAREGLSGYVNAAEYEDSIFMNLEDILSSEQLAKLRAADRLIYINTADGKLPFFINIAGSAFAELAGITYDHYEIGITINPPHEDAVDAMIELIIGE